VKTVNGKLVVELDDAVQFGVAEGDTVFVHLGAEPLSHETRQERTMRLARGILHRYRRTFDDLAK
jgi:hypothetical protein